MYEFHDLTPILGHFRTNFKISGQRQGVIIVTLAVSATVLEILTLKSRKWLIFPTPPLLTPPLGGNPVEFLYETYRTKTRRMGLSYGENFIILTSNVFV